MAPLDAKAVEQKGRDLTKAFDSSPSSDTSFILSILSDLRTGVVASESLLRSTKIGVTVNKLKQHPNPQVKKQAGDLVGKWRTDVQRAKGSGASTPRPQQNGGAAGSPKLGSSSSPKQAGKRPDVPKDKRNTKTDGVKWQVTDNDTRDNCVKLMYDGLAFMSEDRKSLNCHQHSVKT